MSFRTPEKTSHVSCSGSSLTDDDDDRISDWASSLGPARQTKSLFDDTLLPTPEEALAYDETVHAFRLRDVGTRLGLDLYGRMKLVNWIRKSAPDPKGVENLCRDQAALRGDEWLVPVIQDDPLLQLDFDDAWSDDDLPQSGPSHPSRATITSEASRIRQLELKLEMAHAEVTSLRGLLRTSFEDGEKDEPWVEVSGSGLGKGIVKTRLRDDDSHYFDSYAENDIHEIMLKDTTRTLSYGRFVLSNPQVFRGATVLDVGCGTGILSMFAARAGAKHVYAIEASGLAGKTREIIKRNGFGDVITVIRSKVEDVELPVKEVDVIVSEWMGYMLLYESMLDSVLTARDRFLAPNGLMAPSQTRLLISGISAEQLCQQSIDFWHSVYSFDMSDIKPTYFEEGIVEAVKAEELLTDGYVVRDINTHTASAKSLDFHTPFTLHATGSTAQIMRGFLTHFDTFFSPHSGAASHVPPSTAVDIIEYPNDGYKRDVPTRQSDPADVSFTTGPHGPETHWKQVIFLLRQPISLEPGCHITGQFYCRKSVSNSRELDVEIHYRKEQQVEDSDAQYTYQMYKVR